MPVCYWLFCTAEYAQQSFFLRLSLRTVFSYWRKEEQESSDHNRMLKLSYFVLISSRPIRPPRTPLLPSIPPPLTNPHVVQKGNFKGYLCCLYRQFLLCDSIDFRAA